MDRTSRLVRWIFAAGSIAWAGALPAAAFTAAQVSPHRAAIAGATMVYAIGSVVCHQLPARSFWLWGRQLPVCARCLGIYIGAAVAALACVALSTPSPRWRRTPRLAAAAAAALPTAATLLYEWTTGVMPSNATRMLAGIVLGATLSALVLAPGDGKR